MNFSSVYLYGICITVFFSFPELNQKTAIEKRVAILENQVAEIEEDLTGLDQDVNFLFDEQVIQDEQILILEQDSDVFDDQIESKPYLLLFSVRSI